MVLSLLSDLHIPRVDATIDADPAFVYNEIIGEISGCEATLLTPNGYLAEEIYNKDHELKRQGVYSIFLQYLKKRRNSGDFDRAQRYTPPVKCSLTMLTILRTHSIIAALRSSGELFPLKQRFTKVYVRPSNPVQCLVDP